MARQRAEGALDLAWEAARAQGYSDDEVTAWRKQWEDWHAWHAQYAATSGDAAAQGDEDAKRMLLSMESQQGSW